jgi:membrane associated rhomboid family serine protease
MTRSLYGTTFLFFLIGLVFGLELLTGLVDDDLMLLKIGALSDNGQLHGQGWRLLTYGFFHGSVLHVGFNCCLLLFAGPRVEQQLGALKLLIIFMVASVIGGLALLAKGALWPTLGTNMGATAGMIGLLAAHFYLAWRRRAQQ